MVNRTRAEQMIKRYSTDEKVKAALKELENYWDELLSRIQIKTDDEKLDRMVNIWNQYQCMVTFNMSRSASYFESGMGRGMGFRDSCQDLLGFVHMIPERARERILDIAATQFPDGSAYHQYQPLTKRGNLAVGSGFNDDPLWLIAGTDAYIKETGDTSILDEMVPFDNNQDIAEPLMEHLRRSFNFTVTHLGPHGLPLIGRADWNDCLNLNCFSKHPGESFQITGPSEGPVAESVFIAGMFVKYGKSYAEILRRKNLSKEAEEAEKHIRKMEETVLKHGWDGEWFLRAYDAFSNPVGSHKNEEASKTDLKPNTALSSTTRPSSDITSSWVRFPAIRQESRRTQESSATTILGSQSQRRFWAMETGPGSSTERSALPTPRRFPRSTAPSPTATPR